ncbi:ChaN family lipoprotein [Bdellovibrio sp. HCB337]|uniref:ChaN family lipoprotein n=1 Tax=Bdellovibrio sp. HCB337 TaxID=3394358 RepID=UPI0039A6B33A
MLTELSRDLQNWIRIRKELYRQMEAQVQIRLGGEDKELAKYRKEYDKEFSKKWRASTRDELYHRLEFSRLVLMGDFHALQQSQKTHWRVLKNFITNRPIVLALECFEAEDQGAIDKFMAGKTSEREFLKSIEWSKKWGFPWDYLRPLIRWAQNKKIPVYGINRSIKKRTAAGLKNRDRFAAQKLHTILTKHPEAIVFAIYGDLHLAQNHIPAELIKIAGPAFRKKIFRIFQNSEKIYFQILERELENSVDVVELSQNAFCLLNVPPWVKWQNYLMYLEHTYDLGLDEYDDAIDYTDHISSYVKIISEELGKPLSCDDLSVYTAQDQQLWAKLHEHFNTKELKWLQTLIEEGNSFYLPNLGIGYLARPTVNHAATLAAKYVHAKWSGNTDNFFDMPKDFLRQIWIEGIAYFGSKIINHKRKTDTVMDIRATLSSRGAVGTQKEPMVLALSQKMHELMAIANRPQMKAVLQPKKKSSYLLASILLGGMMGERLYTAYRKGILSKPTLMSFLRKSLAEEKFNVAYYEMMEIIESLPAPFRSKKEKM